MNYRIIEHLFMFILTFGRMYHHASESERTNADIHIGHIISMKVTVETLILLNAVTLMDPRGEKRIL